MPENASERRYSELDITAESPDTEIWLCDDAGSLVVKKVGRLREFLLPGDYVVEFGLGTPCYAVPLRRDSSYSESELLSGGPCQRPQFEVPDDDDEKGVPIEHPVLGEILAKKNRDR